MEGTVRMKTALQQLIEWGDKMMADHPLKVLSFAEAIDKAEELLEVEKEQTIHSYKHGQNNGFMYSDGNGLKIEAEQYYNETYKKS